MYLPSVCFSAAICIKWSVIQFLVSSCSCRFICSSQFSTFLCRGHRDDSKTAKIHVPMSVISGSNRTVNGSDQCFQQLTGRGTGRHLAPKLLEGRKLAPICKTQFPLKFANPFSDTEIYSMVSDQPQPWPPPHWLQCWCSDAQINGSCNRFLPAGAVCVSRYEACIKIESSHQVTTEIQADI